MIVFDLECKAGSHRFEGWFGSSDDYAGQQARGLVTCPQCGSADVDKAVMAPRIARKGNQLPERSPRTPSRTNLPASRPVLTEPKADMMLSAPMPPEAMALMEKLATMQAEALKSSRFVGATFANDARAMHYGDREPELIHGQATVDEAKDLLEEGIAIAPLPFPILPPEQAN